MSAWFADSNTIRRHRYASSCLRVLLALAAFVGPTQPPAAAPPDTEIFLAPLGSGVSVGRPVNITNNPGYDNQPSFTPDGASLLFTSIRGGGTQTDIYRYDIASGATVRSLETPRVSIPDGHARRRAHLGDSRVEADGTQRLWRFTLDGGAPELVLPGVKPVGYHAWAGDRTLVLFVLGSPATLRLARTRQAERPRSSADRHQPIDPADSRRHHQLRRAHERRRWR